MNALIKTIEIDDLVEGLPEIVKELEAGTTAGFDLTRDGRLVALVRPPQPSLHGYLRGSVRIPPGFDLTAPVIEDEMHAELGRVHE